MLNNFGLLFSTVMLVIVILRAVQLDRRQPWFEVTRDKKPAKPASATSTEMRRQRRKPR